jgi:hypothetical protein
MHLDLSDDETAVLTKELDDITCNDRYPFSERIRTLKAILAKLRPKPVREPYRHRRCMRPREQPPLLGDGGSVGSDARFFRRLGR